MLVRLTLLLRRRLATLRAALLVGLRGDLPRQLLQILDLALHVLRVVNVPADERAHVLHLFLELVGLGRGHLVLELGQLLLDLIAQGLGVVFHRHAVLLLLVGLAHLLGLLNHALDIRVREAAARAHSHGLLLARGLVHGADVDHAIGVDVEGHLDLRHATGGGRQAHKVELAKQLVVRRHLSLALEDLDAHLRLVVRCRGEGLRLLRGYRRVPGDKAREHAAERLDTEGQWGHIQQQDVLYIALEHATLDRGAHGYGLVGIHSLRGLHAIDLLHRLTHQGHPRRASDQKDAAQLRGG
mmetsp:Transcript_30367/g.87593  ORF Transcript_30367/g.87593 Transcript_30367/m.87593 type:complete len:298 (-) Transcript_30367:1052-1945(-)